MNDEPKPAQSDDPDAAYIRAELNAADSATRMSLEHYRAAGERFVRKKAELGQGNWLPWLKANGFKQQRASECVRLFEGWDKLPPGGSFTLKDALRVIAGSAAGKEAPPPAPDAVDDGKRLILPAVSAATAAHFNRLMSDLEWVLGTDDPVAVVMMLLEDVHTEECHACG